MDHRVHVVTTSQELLHRMNNFVKLMEDYLGEENPLCLSMETCPRQVDRFNYQYNKAFVKDPLFGAYLVYRIHQHVQVFLHS